MCINKFQNNLKLKHKHLKLKMKKIKRNKIVIMDFTHLGLHLRALLQGLGCFIDLNYKMST